MRELNLLSHIYRSNNALPPHVLIPPGDDTAAIRITDPAVLVTVDQLADGVHVDLATTPLEKIARKAITRNLSDIAAMAAKPLAAVAAACLPRDFGDDRAVQLFDAMRRTAEQYNCPLVGGDIAVWDGRLLLSVTLLAQPDGVTPVTRAGSQPGDHIYVTGALGGSTHTLDGYTHHLDFEPRLNAARILAKTLTTRLHAMIDLSDGLAMDLPRLCGADNPDQAQLQAELWVDQLPISPAARAAAQQDGRPPWQHALCDGEDYELCFTVADHPPQPSVPDQIDAVPVTRIGVIKPHDGKSPTITLKMPDGSTQPLERAGWEHKS